MDARLGDVAGNLIPWLWYDALDQRSYWLLREHGGKVGR
jgi:hypothetical protein